MPTQTRSLKRGFTLVELMIVLLIMALLAAILVPNMLSAKARAQLTACIDTQKHMANALELYRLEYKLYPNTLSPAFYQDFYRAAVAADCPTAPNVPYDYQVDQTEHRFTIICGGGVHHVLIGTVQDNYPQYSHMLGRSVLGP
ncbi:MAG: prepilin-type N-terminal cleavage/methylation domain-containing protein [Candidatus Eremiobacterota bacterium]